MTKPNLSALTTTELAAMFNDLTKLTGDKPVNRFSDKATAIKRVTKAMDAAQHVAAHTAAIAKPTKAAQRDAKAASTPKPAYVVGTCPACGATADITCGRVVEHHGKQEVINEHEALCHGCGHQFNYDNGKALKARGAANNSAGVAASWTRPEVAAARAARHAVKVAGKGQFKSVAAAFAALNLPSKLIISTRMALVAGETVTLDGNVFTLA